MAHSRLLFNLILVLALLTACSPAAPTSMQGPLIEVEVLADGVRHDLSIPLGSSAGDAIEMAGLDVGPLDQVEPAQVTQMQDGDQVQIVRVQEDFDVEIEDLPFPSRTVRNESLTEGEERLIQEGVSGRQEITYRLLYEDGELVSRNQVGVQVLEAPVEEIIMVGVQAPATAQPIAGRLAYLAAGNAWLIEGNSGQRRAIVTSGDLDGRVFSVSPDGEWLLFTRASDEEGQINSLWAARLDEGSQVVVSLRAGNIVHYAGWRPDPDQARVYFSTVEPSEGPPGWTANNDLWQVRFTPAGTVFSPEEILEPRTDSLYNWWGSTYAWSPDGEGMAFARPDGIGIVLTGGNDLEVRHELLPFQTDSEWAWMPTVAWSPDSERLYFVDHVEQAGLTVQKRSPLYDLVAMDAGGGNLMTLAEGVGMFAQPALSPAGESVAFLQAINPNQSEVSDYQLMVVDADGGGATRLFPPLGAQGLSPQAVAWSPAPDEADSSLYIALVYLGDLWLVDTLSGATLQLTADGLVSSLSWGD